MRNGMSLHAIIESMVLNRDEKKNITHKDDPK